jgi:hypothetical protein
MAVGKSDSRQFRSIFKAAIPFTATVNFGSAGATDSATSFAAATITVAEAALGDLVLISPSIDLVDVTLSASVTAAAVVTAVVNNGTGDAVDLASQTITGVVLKFADDVGIAGI